MGSWATWTGRCSSRSRTAAHQSAHLKQEAFKPVQMAPPHHRRVESGSLAEFARLMETLPTGRGPATTARREAIWRQVSAERNARSMGPLAAMDQGLRYIEELEHTLPAGSKRPLSAPTTQVRHS